MGDEGDAWDGYREAQQKRRAERLPKRTDEILALVNSGYRIKKLSDYQYRVNDTLDLYPIHRRFHNIKTGKRGTYNNLSEFVRSVFEDRR